jgi:hypothetical protein
MNEENLARKYAAALDALEDIAFRRSLPWHVEQFLPALAAQWRDRQ